MYLLDPALDICFWYTSPYIQDGMVSKYNKTRELVHIPMDVRYTLQLSAGYVKYPEFCGWTIHQIWK